MIHHISRRQGLRRPVVLILRRGQSDSERSGADGTRPGLYALSLILALD